MRKKYSLHQALASDECSDTASTTNGSDLETTLSCTDDMVAPIQPELLKSLVEQEKHLECGSADNENDKVDPRDSVTGVSKQNFDRAITDDTTRLDEDELSIIESSKYSILVDNVQQEPILELKVSQLKNKSVRRFMLFLYANMSNYLLGNIKTELTPRIATHLSAHQ